MSHAEHNAFFRHGKRGDNGGSSIDDIEPLRAELASTDYGWALRLRPMRAVHAMPVLRTIDHGDPAGTLLFGLDADGPCAGGRARVAGLFSDLGIACESLDQTHCVVDDAGFERLLSRCAPSTIRAVRIEGPIEPLDALVIDRAVAAGRSPLEMEIRATAALHVVGDELIELHVRRRDDAVRLVAENFRHYLSAMCDAPVSDFDAPPCDLLERLLSVSGSILVRPLETQIYPTSVDIGVTAAVEGEPPHPAERSLIYDRPSDTWHDED